MEIIHEKTHGQNTWKNTWTNTWKNTWNNTWNNTSKTKQYIQSTQINKHKLIKIHITQTNITIYGLKRGTVEGENKHRSADTNSPINISHNLHVNLPT